MTALIIADIAINNEQLYREYIKLITPSVRAYGGHYVVRGGQPQTLDGHWQSERIVVMEFPDRDTAVAWLNDRSLADIHNMRRDNASRCNMIVCDSIDGHQSVDGIAADERLGQLACAANIDIQPAWHDSVKQHLATAAKMAEKIEVENPDFAPFDAQQ